MQRIIVATDGSPGANRAVDTAARLAKAVGSGLVILTVGGNISGAELRRLAGIDGDVSLALESADAAKVVFPVYCSAAFRRSWQAWRRVT
jgi:nucleotide-binding universal stress UspA family protein